MKGWNLPNNICCDTHIEHINAFCGLNLAVGILTPRLWAVNDRGSSLSVVGLLQAENPEKSFSIPGTDGEVMLFATVSHKVWGPPILLSSGH